MKTRQISILLLLGNVFLISASSQEVQPVPATPPAIELDAVQVRPTPPDKNASVILKIDSARLVDSSGQLVGKMENIVLNPHGCAEAAIVAGERGKLIPLPWELVRFGGETRSEGTTPGETLTFIAGADRTAVLQAPGFVRTDWPVVTKEGWLQDSYTHFHVQPGAAVGAAAPPTTVISGGVSSTNRLTLTNRVIQPPIGRTNVVPPIRTNLVVPPLGTPPGVSPPILQPGTPTPPGAPTPPPAAPPSAVPQPPSVPPPTPDRP